MRVTVAVALVGRQEVIEVDVAKGATAADAIGAARVEQRFPELGPASAWRVGVWSREAAPGTRLREGDRVEIYRALKVDPKAMRRARVKRAP
jgi:putative ubiquitin-RnfH superfamily antitoxin RatB of RatAB toxin-antitoxin module